MHNNFFINSSAPDDPIVEFLNLKDEKVVIVSGRVKSGKTICLLLKLKQILQKNPQAIILWVTSNTIYKSFLCSIFHQLGIRCKIETINEFIKCDKRSFDYVIVDEASFLTEEQLLEIASATTKSLILSITEGGILPAFFFKREERGIDVNTFSRLFGVTPHALYFMHHDNRDNGTKRLISKLYEDRAMVSDCIVDNCLHNCRYKEITPDESAEEFMMKCIVHHNEDNVGIIFFTNDEVSESYRKFRELKYKVECKYNCVFGWENNINFDSTKPKLLTIHSCAGVSFDTVFLVLNERVVRNIDDYRDLLAYALTRSHRDVVIVSNSSLPSIITDNATSIYTEMQL